MAIAFDASASASQNAASPLNFNHTCTGSNRILFVGIWQGDSDNVTGVTYNAVSMTLVDKVSMPTPSGGFVYLFYLTGPATGTNQVSISYTGTHNCYAESVSYTGAKQSGQPDASAKPTSASIANGSDFTGSITTVADNSWIVWKVRNNQGLMSASTNSTQRASSDGASIKTFDTNGAQTPAGSKSMAVTNNSGAAAEFGSIMASFAPTVTATHFLPLMGAGT